MSTASELAINLWDIYTKLVIPYKKKGVLFGQINDYKNLVLDKEHWGLLIYTV